MCFSARRLLHHLTWMPFLFAAFACGSPNDPLPEEVIRIWRNSAPGYAENYFEIRKEFILFGIDPYQFKIHEITGVQLKASARETELRIEYRAADGGAVPLLLVYTPGNPPRLRIGARPEQWVPEEHARWLNKEAS